MGCDPSSGSSGSHVCEDAHHPQCSSSLHDAHELCARHRASVGHAFGVAYHVPHPGVPSAPQRPLSAHSAHPALAVHDRHDACAWHCCTGGVAQSPYQNWLAWHHEEPNESPGTQCAGSESHHPHAGSAVQAQRLPWAAQRARPSSLGHAEGSCVGLGGEGQAAGAERSEQVPAYGHHSHTALPSDGAVAPAQAAQEASSPHSTSHAAPPSRAKRQSSQTPNPAACPSTVPVTQPPRPPLADAHQPQAGSVVHVAQCV
mmetsp:Transcript_27893/g.89980  ORF Transcript_27893/g.89980 Transcript_27893/m.89980 type:complete len:258 (+) Transcript_27893:940-1713(+)